MDRPMARRHFSVAEVERLIPTLERIFTQVFQLRIALRGEEKKLERAGLRVSRESADKDTAGEPPAAKQARMMFRAYYETLADTLARVEALGGEVKDLDLGLVDFPGKRGDEDILLCWKVGERSIDYWHPVDTGYSGRRPIDDQVPREPRGLD
jgi:hypothetical protein